MNQNKYNMIFTLAIGTLILIVLLPNEKEVAPPEPINYELYEWRFKELENSIDSLRSQVIEADSSINTIKFKIIADEKTIRNASNSDVDSIFNAMVTRQRKGSVR